MNNSDLNLSNQYRVDSFYSDPNINYSFMLTIARDGENPARSIYYFNSAVDASEAYNRYTDWGFAKDYLTVRLYEPNGKINEKVLFRPKAGECVFVRQQYYDAENALLKVKDHLEEDLYNNLVNDFAKIFSKDNQRFDHVRFFELTKAKVMGE